MPNPLFAFYDTQSLKVNLSNNSNSSSGVAATLDCTGYRTGASKSYAILKILQLDTNTN